MADTKSNLINNFFNNLAEGEQLRHLFDFIPDVLFFVKDCESKLIYCNRPMLSFFRCDSIEDIYGKTGADFFPESIASPYIEDDKWVISNKKPLVNKIELALKENGELAWHNTNKLPLYDKTGEIAGLMGITRWLSKADQKLHPAANIMPALNHIQTNYTEDIQIAELAQLCRLSVSQFHRTFKQHFSQTPLQFILKMRIQSSCRLLRSSRLSIYEISEACGFNDQNYFARHFKKIVGSSPRDFRKIYY